MVAMITTCAVNRTPQYHVFVEDALTCACGQQKSFPSPPSYALAELEQLAEQWAIERQMLPTDRWTVSCFLAWLAKVK